MAGDNMPTVVLQLDVAATIEMPGEVREIEFPVPDDVRLVVYVVAEHRTGAAVLAQVVIDDVSTLRLVAEGGP